MNSRISLVLVFAALPLLAYFGRSRSPEQAVTGVALGRKVYVSEGCIHCHSQFVRPDTGDESGSGLSRDPDFSREQVPVLIGNRRQGPDLMNVGQRLSREWHRIHLVDPRRVVPASRMPAYAHLFTAGDPRGEALLDYLMTLGREQSAKREGGDSTDHAQTNATPAQSFAAARAPTSPRVNAP